MSDLATPQIAPARTNTSRASRNLALLVLAIACFAAFGDVVRNEFVWDDFPNLVENDRYRGLGSESLRWMFRTAHGGHFQPLTWLSFAFDYSLWGLSPAGFHLTNLLLHVLTALCIFGVAKTLIAAGRRNPDAEGDSSGPILGALVAALLFAVHPLRVESVAWVTERRDVLSGVWLTLAVVFYIRAVRPPNETKCTADWVVSCLSYGLSLLSKATGITLPLVLLMLDVYPLRRAPKRSEGRLWPAWKNLLLEKAPFVVLAAAAGWRAVRAQRQAGALWGWSEHPLTLRIAQAFYGLVFYPWKTLVPTGLVPLYEQRPDAQPFDVVFVISALLVLGISVAAWLLRGRLPGLTVAWAAYVVLISPVLGLAQSGPQVVADRYSYVACIPWAILLGGWVASVWGRRAAAQLSVVRIGITAAIGIVSCLLIGLTRAQVRVWADSHTLWTTTIQRAPDTGLAHANLAGVLLSRGDAEGAKEHGLKALSILPGNRVAHGVLASASLSFNDYAAAEKHFRIALEISEILGRLDDSALDGLAVALERQGKFAEAEEVYRMLIAAAPTSPYGPFGMAAFLERRDRLVEAASMLEKTILLEPSFALAHLRLGFVRAKLADPIGALASWDKALSLTGDAPTFRAEVAWGLATSAHDRVRNGQRAIALADSAVRDTQGGFVRAREALAAAIAELGDYARAVETAEAILSDTGLAIEPQARTRIEDALARYREGRPMRE